MKVRLFILLFAVNTLFLLQGQSSYHNIARTHSYFKPFTQENSEHSPKELLVMEEFAEDETEDEKIHIPYIRTEDFVFSFLQVPASLRAYRPVLLLSLPPSQLFILYHQLKLDC